MESAATQQEFPAATNLPPLVLNISAPIKTKIVFMNFQQKNGIRFVHLSTSSFIRGSNRMHFERHMWGREKKNVKQKSRITNKAGVNKLCIPWNIIILFIEQQQRQ